MNPRKKLNWISGAVGKPGALHKQMHIPTGEKIPKAKLEAAANSPDKKKAKRARLALTLRSLN